MTEAPQFAAVLKFWFEEIKPAQWWQKNKAFDQRIARRFGPLHHRATQGELYGWRDNALGRLAEIILLDQFSRNIYRHQPASFASDGIALVLSQEALSLGLDQSLTAQQRSFLYMPWMHSESLAIHDVAVELFRANGLKKSLAIEIRHRDIIARFGRYPHRNAILGRESSAEEVAFLQQPGSRF